MFRKTERQPRHPWADKSFELMTYDELLAIRIRVDQEIDARGPGELEALKEKLTLIAKTKGLSPSDLFGERPSPEAKQRKKRQVKVKYRNPDNPGETWTGIGKPKKWLQTKLDQGGTLESFAVA